jgi:hypothetical protein
LVNDALFVDTYWPNGTQLVAEGDGYFQLEGTNNLVIFDVQADKQPSGLTYVFRGKTYHYARAIFAD